MIQKIQKYMRGIVIGSSGWVLLGIYLAYEYTEYDDVTGLLGHIGDPNFPQVLFHIMIVLAPLMLMLLAYTIEKGMKLQQELNVSNEQLQQELFERKKAEEELILFRDLLDQSNDAIFVIDPEKNRFLDVNDTACTILGFTREELLNMRVKDIDKDWGDDSDFRGAVEGIRKKRHIVFEREVTRKDGTTFLVEMSVTFVHQKEMDYIVAVMRDITERKRAENNIRESEERYSKAAKIGHFGHWDWNFVEDRVIWSGEAYSIFGVDPDQFSPSYKDFVDLVYPDDKDHFESKIKASVSDNFPLDVEYRIIRPDGEMKYVHSVGNVRYDKKGKPTRLVGTIQDITERKSTEKALKRYSEDLKKSNRLKDLFIDIMRHDLLNPAGAAKNMIDLALKNETDPHKKEILEIVHNSTGRIIDLVENASILAALESGETLEFKETDLGKVLKKVANEMAHQAEEKNVKIKVPENGEFKAQANPLMQDVFTNLIGNAIKYGPENSEVVAKIEGNGSSWKISVADKGEGIPDEYKESIFDRFKRVKKEGVKGTGLGLAIAKKVVEAHKGRVWCEDNPKGGSVFIVVLPKK
ncbi:MAG: PAS domain S-box protein [Candidatus Hydrothermarchaeales archaeon]